MTGPAMSAADVMSALRLRWPESEYVHVPEAPQDSGRQGRKIDLLVISMWHSRRHERDAVEVKVSMSDLRREIGQPEKADWWWQHSHRFWVAVPEAMAEKAKPELPTGWGLLSVRSDGDRFIAHIKVKPLVNRDCKPLPEASVIGLLRAAENAGPSALTRASQDGYERGLAAGRREAATSGPALIRGHPELDRIREQDRLLTELTGRNLSSWHREWGAQLAEAIRLLTSFGTRPADIDRALDRAIADARAAARDIEKIRDAAADVLRPQAKGALPT